MTRYVFNAFTNITQNLNRIDMGSSSYWKSHFRNNLTQKRIDWSQTPCLTKAEQESILPSLRAWQLGETSDGRHLLKAARRYSAKTSDPDYIAAIELFIKEEQKHGNNLGRYIDLLGQPRKKKDWGDSLFRFVRYFNTSMELWTISVVIVESSAQIFYQAMHDAANCQLLKEICADILKDEAHHIKFQNERLHTIFNGKNVYSKALTVGLYGLLFFAIIHAVWFGHRRLFLAGNISKRKFFEMMYFKFFGTMKFIFSSPNFALAGT